MMQHQVQNNKTRNMKNNEEYKGFWARTKLLYILIIPLIVLMAYAFSTIDFTGYGLPLTKIDVSNVKDAMYRDSKAVADTDSIARDSMLLAQQTLPLDTAHQRILFFGDSMVEGLVLRLADYAMENGYELYSVCWYSSTSEIWSKTDTLEHFIRQAQPTFVIVALCSNEQFVRDLDNREKYVGNIVSRIEKFPYVWIGPPTWKSETGINEIIQRRVTPKRYFESRNLTFQRGKDHVHPTFTSAAMWMDSIAVWLEGKTTPHPIRMTAPAEKRKRKWHATYLSPYEL